MIGSTDVGDVSWVVPTVQARGATYAIGTPGHSWQLTAQGKLPAAHKGLAHVAKVMAGTAIEVIQDEVLLARAKADHQARISRNPYVCPLPDDLAPPSRCRRKPRRQGFFDADRGRNTASDDRSSPHNYRLSLRGPAGRSNLDPPVRIWPEIASLRSQ